MLQMPGMAPPVRADKLPVLFFFFFFVGDVCCEHLPDRVIPAHLDAMGDLVLCLRMCLRCRVRISLGGDMKDVMPLVGPLSTIARDPSLQ